MLQLIKYLVIYMGFGNNNFSFDAQLNPDTFSICRRLLAQIWAVFKYDNNIGHSIVFVPRQECSEL